MLQLKSTVLFIVIGPKMPDLPAGLLIVRYRNLEYQPKRAIPSIENVFVFFEREYIVHYKTK